MANVAHIKPTTTETITAKMVSVRRNSVPGKTGAGDRGITAKLLKSHSMPKTYEWVLNKAGVKRELLGTLNARKLAVAYYGHTIRKQRSCLEKDIMQETMPGARRRGRPHTAWMANINRWTGLPVEESIRMTEDRDTWIKYVHGVANPGIEEG